MDDTEYVIYSTGLAKVYEAKKSEWDAHIDRLTQNGEKSVLTLLAQGLTEEQANGIVKLMKENEDEI